MEAARLSALRQKRGIIKGQFTRFESFLDDENNHNRIELLETRLERTNKYFDDFEDIQNEIELLDTDEEIAREAIENQYYSIIGQAKALIKSKQASKPSNVGVDPLGNINLPRLSLPVFSGNFDSWLTFHDEFVNLIHNNNSLTNMQKFFYLRSSLKDEPLKLIQCYQVSNENYPIVYDLLIERYQRTRRIVDSHINALLEIPSATKESAQMLRVITDGFYRHVSILNKMGLPVKQWDAFLVCLINTKLDNTTKREWDNSLNDENRIPQFEEIMKFMNKKCFSLESARMAPQKGEHIEKAIKFERQHSLVAKNQGKKCNFCKGPHLIFNCSEFLKLSIPERYEAAKLRKLCFNCLRSGHNKPECNSTNCKRCDRRHSTLLHPEEMTHEIQTESPKLLEAVTAGNSARSSVNSTIAHTTNSKKLQSSERLVLLSTAKLIIFDSERNPHICKALLDSGSQSNIVSGKLAKLLNLKLENCTLPLVGVNNQVTKITHRTKATVKSCNSAFTNDLSFLVLPNITERIPSATFDKKLVSFPSDVHLADPHFNVSEDIDLLLGANIFYELIRPRQIKLSDSLLLQESVLGWILAGTVVLSHAKRREMCNIASISNDELNRNLKNFWELEELPKKKYLSAEQRSAEDFFVRTTTRDKNGKFIVRLPFVREICDFGDSYSVAPKRYKFLENRFSKDIDLKRVYSEFMNEYIYSNHMSSRGIFKHELIPQPYFLLPHHCVIKKDSTTTRCRVVFDGSAQTSSGISLNDTLNPGYTLQDNLFDIVMRLRLYKYVLSSDIKMMFRQIWVHPDDRKYQQILWKPQQENEAHVFTLDTVTYGTTSAPFLAQRCLQQLALENMEKFPRTCAIILNSFYMDDLLVSIKTIQEVFEVYRELTSILAQGGFELRKWASNDETILESILEISKDKEKAVELRETSNLKTLGIAWLSNSDTLNYTLDIQFNFKEVTKRNVLSTISKIFDPLGLIGPVVIKSKIFLQRLWQFNINWDEPLSADFSAVWLSHVKQLQTIKAIRVDRLMLIEDAEIIELHGFSDASEAAYGACIYLVSTDLKGIRKSALVCAKSKVAPHKTCTLPRLELLAATLLANLAHSIVEILGVNISKRCYYSDSTIVLAWLKAEPYRLRTFVANRVSVIQNKTSVDDWNYINTRENPADIISRGVTPIELQSSHIWWHGPEFLTTGEFPKLNKVSQFDYDGLPELKPDIQFNLKVTELDNSEIIKRYSSLEKLRRVVAYCIRFKKHALKQNRNLNINLTVCELEYAMIILLKMVQRQEFKAEIEALNKGINVSNRSKLLKLHPFLDKDSLLRVGGRLKHADIDFVQKHPIILPKNNKLTSLLIEHEHKKHLHAGAQNLLSLIRLTYWPIDGKNQVKAVIRSCIRCYKFNPKPAEFIMGNLPHARVTPSRPFTRCGVDFAGPILIKEKVTRNTKLIKTYICIFVCFDTRACHIELVNDLSTHSFLNALKRFISRRGKPAEITSDNGLNFVGASNHFEELYKLINDDTHNKAVLNFLSEDKIKWSFIPAASPHMGGLWEAAVKSAKFHLKRTIGNNSLTYEEMYTLLTQIEACLNSRPLTPLSNDPDDLLPLSPSHFLIGDSLVAPPQEDVRQVRCNRLSRYHLVQQMMQHFWARWSREYLTQLQQRNKWCKDPGQQLQVGSLVVLVEENQPPFRWPMARITELHPGPDGTVRVVSLRVCNGNVLKRSIAKVCVLPIPKDD